MGFLGTRASFIADVNLITQLVIIVLLVAGWRMMSDKKKARQHGQLMVLAVIMNGLTIAGVMVPSLIINFGAITINPTGVGPLDTMFHSIIGTIAWLYGAYLSFVWGLKPATVECFKRKRAMKPVFYVWLAAAVLGVLFYINYYIF